ncbi:uncharacterized protein I206_103020 [Kwoniella pini CBS 10737]|uniref:Uncharacterized protein n=1 Tax=Kwoniella pini CBS 10737 TaxID=1296096 RepID=A0AAJ8L1Z9_9TREE
MEDHPLVQLHPIVIQLATVPAVAIASYKALNVWRAVSSLPLNPHTSGSDASERSATSEAFRQWRALTATKKAKKIAVFLLFFSLGLSFHLFMVFGLSKISSQSVMDIIWCIILIAMYAGPISYVSDLVFPTPRSVRYHRAKTGAPMRMIIEFEGDTKKALKIEIARLLLSLIVVGGMIYSTWAGYTYLHSILGASYIITVVASIRYPKMSIRRIIQVISGYLIIAPPLSIALGLFITYITGGSKTDEDPAEPRKEESLTIMSDWVLSLIFVFSDIFGAIVPGIITAMTLRFEYSLINEPVHRPSEASTDAPVRIPNEYPSFPKPIFISSLLSLLASLGFLNIVTFVFPDIVWLGITPLNIYITVPTVFGSTACAAAYFGKFGQWWRYNEVWIPQNKVLDTSEEGAKDLDDEEAALLPTEVKETA